MINKKFIIGILIIIILSLLFIYYKPLSCEQLENIVSDTHNRLKYSCQDNSECNSRNDGWCGSCVNNDISNNEIKPLLDVYNKGVEKGCFPQVECKKFECECINNICTEEYIN